MANLCIKVVHVSTVDSELLERFLRLLRERYACRHVLRHGRYSCELNFTSFDRFPLDTVREITSQLPTGSDLHINVVSNVASTGHVAMHTFQRDIWTEDDTEHINSIINHFKPN